MKGTLKKIIEEGLMKCLFTLKVRDKGNNMWWWKTQGLAIVISCSFCQAYTFFPVYSELEAIAAYKFLMGRQEWCYWNMVRSLAMGESKPGRSCSHRWRKAATDNPAEQWSWQRHTKIKVPKPILHGESSRFCSKTNKQNLIQYDILIKFSWACYLCVLKLSSRL